MTNPLNRVQQRIYEHFTKKNFFEGTHMNRALLFIETDSDEIISYKEGDHLTIPRKGEEVVLSNLSLSDGDTPDFQGQTGVFEVVDISHRIISIKDDDRSKDMPMVQLAVSKKDSHSKWTKDFHIDGNFDTV